MGLYGPKPRKQELSSRLASRERLIGSSVAVAGGSWLGMFILVRLVGLLVMTRQLLAVCNTYQMEDVTPCMGGHDCKQTSGSIGKDEQGTSPHTSEYKYK